MKGNSDMKNTYKKATRFIASFLAMMLIISTFAPAGGAYYNNIDVNDEFCIPVTIDASHYISAYSAGMSAGSNGNLIITYSITAPRRMTEIGSTRIEIFENGIFIKAYVHTSTSGMMIKDMFTHAGTIIHKGVVGRSYRATVHYKSGDNTGFDTRSLQTITVIAR